MPEIIIRKFGSRITIAALAVIIAIFLACGILSSDNDSGEWKTASPESQGLDISILSALDAKILAGDYGEVHSLLIIRNGYLVYEKYYRGYNAEQQHRLYSVTKSFTSALIGIAIGQGLIDNTDHNIITFFPEYDVYANMNSDKEAMTLDDALTMRMGTYWDESTYDFEDPRNSIYQIRNSEDWLKYVLDQPMVDVPGTTFRYNTGASTVLSGILRNQTGRQAAEFAAEVLFEPLGVDNYEWEAGAQNLSNTGWGLWMRPRDMARFGQMYLDNGLWKGTQVVPSDWVVNSTDNHTDAYQQYYYGYQWWLVPMENVSGHTPSPDDIKIAWGYGDQFIFFIPALDMVVVSTAGNYDGQSAECAADFVPEYIVQAVIR